MAEITAALVKQLREQTGAGMMDCKTALTETGGDLEDATDWLRKKGLAAAAKKAGRLASEGLIGVQVEGRRGAMVEVNSETDFVARNENFQQLVRDDRRRWRLRTGGDLDVCCSASVPAAAARVADEITHAIAVIGENMNLRRTAAVEVGEGVVGSYVHGALAPGLGKIGVLVGLQSAGDAGAARRARQAARDARRRRPAAWRSASTASIRAWSRASARSMPSRRAASGKPDNIIDKIVDGRMRKFYEEVVLLEQAFVIDPDLKVKDAIERLAEKLGSPIAVTGFERFALGEGLAPKTSNLADEVPRSWPDSLSCRPCARRIAPRRAS